MISEKMMILFPHLYIIGMMVHLEAVTEVPRGGFRGATRPASPLFLLVKKLLEPYICPYANNCLKSVHV